MRALLAVLAVLVIMALLLAGLPAPQPAASTGAREAAPGVAHAPALAPRRATQPAAALRSASIAGSRLNVPPGSLEEADGQHASIARNPASSAGESRGAPAGTGTVAAAPRVHRFKRGSREHAAAVGEALASPDYSRVVGPLARLYLAYFGRVPDYDGFGHYIGEREAGVPLADIAEEFAGSAEFDMRYGHLDNAAFVDRVHRNVGAAAAHRDYWIAQLDSGAMTRGQVMLQFSESDRFRAATHDAVFIAMAYAEALRRAPTPAERAHWESFLSAGHPHGAMLEALVAGDAKD